MEEEDDEVHPGPRSHRALGAVLHVVHQQLDLRLLSDERVLEEGDAAQEDGVTGALGGCG